MQRPVLLYFRLLRYQEHSERKLPVCALRQAGRKEKHRHTGDHPDVEQREIPRLRPRGFPSDDCRGRGRDSKFPLFRHRHTLKSYLRTYLLQKYPRIMEASLSVHYKRIRCWHPGSYEWQDSGSEGDPGLR